MTVRKLILASAFLCCSSFSRAEDLILLQGERRPFPRSRSVWVEDGNVIRVDEVAQNDFVRALKPGESEVHFGEKTLHITVLSLEQQRTRQLLEKELKNTLSLNLAVKSAAVSVTGKLLRWHDWQTLATACQNTTCQYQMIAEISPELLLAAEKKINEQLSRRALPRLRLEPDSPPAVHLPSKSAYADEIEKFLSGFGIHVERSVNAIEMAPLIKVQIIVAEVKKDHILQYGVKWPNSYQAQILPVMSQGIDPQFISAQFWEHSGAGRVLANPNILCRSGKDAEFVAGGEFPIKIINFHLQDVIWKKYGIVLKISPTADYSGHMSISLETEVSSIDPSRTVDGVPGLFTNRVQSHFDLAHPRTIALSGLIKNEDSKNTDGLPGLSRIPILGALFSSKDFHENRSELVIFVRPEIVNPDEQDDEPTLPEEIKNMQKETSSEISRDRQ